MGGLEYPRSKGRVRHLETLAGPRRSLLEWLAETHRATKAQIKGARKEASVMNV
jgi:hypothetical protein